MGKQSQSQEDKSLARQCDAALPFQYLKRGVEMAKTPT